MKKISKLVLLLTMTLISHFVAAQQQVEMADTMRSEGKIYVVVAIVLVILAGLLGYLIFIDRKVSGIEKRIEGKKH